MEKSKSNPATKTTTKTSKKSTKKAEPAPIAEEEDDLTAMLKAVVEKANAKEEVEDEVPPFDTESEVDDIFEEEEAAEDEMITLDTVRLTAIRNAFKSADSSTKAKVKNHLADYGNKLCDTMSKYDVAAIEKALGLSDEV